MRNTFFRYIRVLLLILPAALCPVAAYAQKADSPSAASAPSATNAPAATTAVAAASGSAATAPSKRYVLGGQVTVIDQQLFPFHSPYAGVSSFHSRSENEVSDTYTLYLGYRIARNLEAYLDPEMARGKALSDGLGLAGFTNGDVIRNPSAGESPYLARYYVRWTTPANGAVAQQVAEGEQQIQEPVPTRRVVVTAGKFAVTDIFDVNSYADNTRTQFMNWDLINNAAYDYAADTRGYSIGAAAEYIHPDYALRVGAFEMPRVANGVALANDLQESNGDQFEAELHPSVLSTKNGPGIVRLLAYVNHADMGNYNQSILLAEKAGSTPSIVATRQPGRVKYGFGLNFEQPLADAGNTGLFGRLGWDDGSTESFAYTEADRAVSLGAQVSGGRWFHRPQDVFAVALAQDDLSSEHAKYLADGGVGFLLGDGKLNYGSERLIESYYNFQLSKLGASAAVNIGPDYQFIAHPGYNKGRGPASVASVRMHFEF